MRLLRFAPALLAAIFLIASPAAAIPVAPIAAALVSVGVAASVASFVAVAIAITANLGIAFLTAGLPDGASSLAADSIPPRKRWFGQWIAPHWPLMIVRPQGFCLTPALPPGYWCIADRRPIIRPGDLALLRLDLEESNHQHAAAWAKRRTWFARRAGPHFVKRYAGRMSFDMFTPPRRMVVTDAQLLAIARVRAVRPSFGSALVCAVYLLCARASLDPLLGVDLIPTDAIDPKVAGGLPWPKP